MRIDEYKMGDRFRVGCYAKARAPNYGLRRWLAGTLHIVWIQMTRITWRDGHGPPGTAATDSQNTSSSSSPT